MVLIALRTYTLIYYCYYNYCIKYANDCAIVINCDRVAQNVRKRGEMMAIIKG